MFYVERPLDAFRIWISISSSCRMEAFFAIAGFLSAASLAKWKNNYLISRMRQLLVPFLFCSVTLIPFAHFVARQDEVGKHLSIAGTDHLWFLISLSIATCIGYAIFSNSLTDMFYKSLFRWGTPAFLILVASLSLIIDAATSKYIYILQNNGSTGDNLTLVPVVVRSFYYTIFYIAAYIAGQNSHKIMNQVPKWLIYGSSGFLIVTIVLYVMSLGIIDATADQSINHVVLRVVSMILSTSLVLTAFSTSAHITNVPRFILALSKSSYTIYLAHYPVIVYTYIALKSTNLPFFLRIVMVPSAGLLIPLAMHFTLVERSRILSFLLNGKRLLGTDKPVRSELPPISAARI